MENGKRNEGTSLKTIIPLLTSAAVRGPDAVRATASTASTAKQVASRPLSSTPTWTTTAKGMYHVAEVRGQRRHEDASGS